MMNIWHDIAPERIKSDDFVACIEISKGGKNKYEMDKETGMLKLDRVLYTSTHYPANYGSSRAHTPTTTTRSMFSCCAARRYCR